MNKILVSGNLTQTPTLKKVRKPGSESTISSADHNASGGNSEDSEGISVTTLALATNNRGNEERVYLDITVWGRLAEIAVKNATKGRAIIIEGKLKQESYTDKSGKRISKLGIVADRIEFPTKKA
jgi:single stranded DNA-binding protein